MQNNISADAHAMIMLCSRLGISIQTDTKIYTLREWNPLAQQLDSMNKRPGDLLGQSAQDITKDVGIPLEEAERIAYLLGRGAAIAIELERLNSLGIWVWTRADIQYPQKYRQRLKASAPLILFGAGDTYLPGQPGLAMVGSRHIDDEVKAIAEEIGNTCANCGLVVYSGGAKGIDTASMRSALEGRGTAVGIVAHSLQNTIRDIDYRKALENKTLTLLTPYLPDAGFSVGGAMGRNKLIYTLADYALVINSDYKKGGTWAGATENLKHKWVPLFVTETSNTPEGNQMLIREGATPLPFPPPIKTDRDFRHWLEQNAQPFEPSPNQLSLFA